MEEDREISFVFNTRAKSRFLASLGMTVSLIQRICSSGHQVRGHYCDEKKKLIAAGPRVRGGCVRRAGSRKRSGGGCAAGGFDGMDQAGGVRCQPGAVLEARRTAGDY